MKTSSKTTLGVQGHVAYLWLQSPPLYIIEQRVEKHKNHLQCAEHFEDLLHENFQELDLHTTSSLALVLKELIFQWDQIHGSSWWIRGKISRALAGKLSIASRMDAYSSDNQGDRLLSDLQKRIDEIKKKYPEPKKKPKKPKAGRDRRGKRKRQKRGLRT